jgi:hypothetical protein
MDGEEPSSDSIHAIRVAACQGLWRYALETAETASKANQHYGDARFLILSLFSRSTRTYEAAVRKLAEGAFAEQIAILNRSLFEDVVDAHWVHLHRDEALERLTQHDRWSRHLRANVQREFTDFFEGWKKREQDLSQEEVEELRGLFGRKGGRSWTGVDFDDRYKAILAYWDDEEQRRYRRWFNAWIHKLNNEIVHPSAFSARTARCSTTNCGGRMGVSVRFHERVARTGSLVRLLDL